MDKAVYRQFLIGILKLAYSGELAAAYAYRGHWHSVSNPNERERIRTIEEEELHHRRLVGEMLRNLGEQPSRWLELKATLIGRILGLLCHVSGWLAPMYGAGKLESRNVKEYENAARYARGCGQTELIECLLTMAEVEWEHEQYFRQQVDKHPLARFLPRWQSPPPKAIIRTSFFQPIE